MTVTTTKEYVGLTGNQTTFDFPFEVQKNEDVYCKINNVLVAKTEYIVGSPSANQLTFETAPTGDLLIYRDTMDTSMRAVFSSGNAIRARDLNDNYEQLLFIIQENEEGIAGNDETIDQILIDIESIQEDIVTIQGDIITINGRLDNDFVKKAGDTMEGPLSMGGFLLSNLEYPVDTTDAASVQYVLDRIDDIEAGGGGTANIETVAPLVKAVNEITRTTTLTFVISTLEKSI